MGGGSSKSRSNSFEINIISPNDTVSELTSKTLLVTQKTVDPEVNRAPVRPTGPKKFKRVASAVMASNRMSHAASNSAQNKIQSQIQQQQTRIEVTKELVHVSSKYPWILKSGNFSNSLKMDSFEMGRIMGTGLMGTVRVAKMKCYNVFVAIKSIKKSFIYQFNDHRHIKNEREILLQLTSPFCIKLFGTFQDNHYIHFILEYSAGGELFTHLTRSPNRYFSPQVAKFYIIEIFSALEHVHQLGYVYRDLKPENVMLDEYGHCKLIDFGFATMPGEDGLCHTSVGTPVYLSPEQLNNKFTNGYTRVVDWWAFGCLLYELMAGLTPFCTNDKNSKYEIYLKILKGKIKFTPAFNLHSKDLISSLCHAELSKRLVDPAVIRNHSYFDIDWQAVTERRMLPPCKPDVKDMNESENFLPTTITGTPPDQNGITLFEANSNTNNTTAVAADSEVSYRDMYQGF